MYRIEQLSRRISLSPLATLSAPPLFRERAALRVLQVVIGLSIVTLVALGAIELYETLTYPIPDIADLVFDDTYFYLGIARSVARGAGSMFRGPLATNGYHPLWLWILSAGAFVFQLSPRGMLAFVIGLGYALKVSLLAWCAIGRKRERLLLGVASLVAMLLYPSVFSDGLETTLLLAALPFLSWVFSLEKLDQRSAIWSGLGFGLLFLVRLDCASVFAAYLIYRVALERRANRFMLVQIGIVAAIVGAYMVGNTLAFGVPVPISGLSKALGSRPGENLGVFRWYWWALRDALVITALLLPWLLRLTGRGFHGHSGDALIVMLGATAFVGVYYAFMSGWEIWLWYLWPCALLTIFATMRLGSAVLSSVASERKVPALSVALCCLALALLGAKVARAAREVGERNTTQIAALVKNEKLNRFGLPERFRQRYSFNRANVELLDQALGRLHGPTIAMGDRAGGLGYWMPDDFKLVHLEGLVGSKELFDARKRGQGVAFVDSLKPDLYVVDRNRFFVDDSGPEAVYGFPEPIQGRSMHEGVMMFCFPAHGLRYDQKVPDGKRLVFDYTTKVPCPRAFEQRLESLMSNVGGLRAFSVDY